MEIDTGRRYNRADLTAPGVRSGSSGMPWRGIDPTARGRHWAIPRWISEVVGDLDTLEALDALDAAGRIHWPKRQGGKPMLKRYIEESAGISAQDVITDIYINNIAAERLGYPTQKPEALLERLIKVSSNPDDIVLDPFCGCGTSVAVAERLRRRWVGIDISPTAIEIMRRRLLRHGCRPTIYNIPDSLHALKQLAPFEFQNWIINAVNGTHSLRRVGDMGIDGYWFFTRAPIQVKQSERVGRNVVDNFETAIRRAGHTTGYIIAFSFGRGAVEEVARAKKEEGLEIALLRVAEVLLLTKRLPATNKFGPQPRAEVIPIPTRRKATDMPTAEELIASARKAAG